MTIPYDTTYVEPGYSATDDIDGNLTSSVVVSGVVDTTTPGTYTISYDVADSSGNQAITQTRTVIVDGTKPVITLVGGHITISLNSVFIEPGYTATDDVDGDITDKVIIRGPPSGTVMDYGGTHVLFYVVADSAGNRATVPRSVIVVADIMPPIITLHGHTNMTILYNATYVEPGYTATDDVDGDITHNVIVTGVVDTQTLGTFIISYAVYDSSGNEAITQTRTVNVVDDDLH